MSKSGPINKYSLPKINLNIKSIHKIIFTGDQIQ
jgi:hypothetical protein